VALYFKKDLLFHILMRLREVITSILAMKVHANRYMKNPTFVTVLKTFMRKKVIKWMVKKFYWKPRNNYQQTKKTERLKLKSK
jgi:spore coat protein CotF